MTRLSMQATSTGTVKGGSSMVLLIDNYDSFSYNLYQLAGEFDRDILVRRNNEVTTDEIETLAPSHILLSPGPGYPKDAGVCIEAVRRFAGKIPILGVCLGHQAVCQAFGAVIAHAKQLMHGKQSVITLDTSCPIFSGLSKETKVARYHSLIAKAETLPSVLTVTAEDKNGEIMAVRHRELEVYGVQFHPESILTPQGRQIMRNFLSIR